MGATGVPVVRCGWSTGALFVRGFDPFIRRRTVGIRGYWVVSTSRSRAATMSSSPSLRLCAVTPKVV